MGVSLWCVCVCASYIVEATWSDWSSWSECTASCGGGRRTRRRSCQGGNTCVGRLTEYSDCNTESCPQGQEGKHLFVVVHWFTNLHYTHTPSLSLLLTIPLFLYSPLSLPTLYVPQAPHGQTGAAGVSAVRHVREAPG